MRESGVRWIALACLALAARAAVIDGVVVESQSGKPLIRARVSLLALSGQAGAARGPYFTDSAGRFSIPLGSGAFLLTAEKRGYAMAAYGQKRWNTPGTPVVLDRDSHFTVEMRLNRLGAASGKVVDDGGFGLEDVTVFAYRDGKPLRLAGQGLTDDRGIFRVAGLQPGRYRFRTGPKQLEDGTGLLPTFAGDTTSADASLLVDVSLDSEADQVNIRPIPGKLLRLSGRVAFPGVSSVFLYSELARRVAAVDQSGRFSFDQLVPGSLELMAEPVPGTGQVGYARLYLSADLDGVTLEAAPSPTVHMSCEGAGRETVLTIRRTAPPEDSQTQQLRCGGGSPLSVGTWEISIATSAKSFVSQVLVASRPAESDEVAVVPGQNVEVGVVVSSLVASLKGKVAGAGGQPAPGDIVMLRAADAAVDRRLYGKRTARTDQNGEYATEGLPPGRYQVAASFDVQTAADVDWSNPSLATVTLEENQTATLNLAL